MKPDPDSWIDARAREVLDRVRTRCDMVRDAAAPRLRPARLHALPGADLRIESDDPDLVDFLAAAFAHLRTDARRDGVPLLRWIIARDDPEAGELTLPAPTIPLDIYGLFQQSSDGDILIERRAGMTTVFESARDIFHTIVTDRDRIENDFLAKPLFRFLTGLFHARGMTIIHSALVGVDGHGILVTGRGGSGKSTISIAALQAGMDFASDDLVAIGDGPDGPVGHSLFGSALLTDWSSQLLPDGPDGVRRPPPASLNKSFLAASTHFAERMARRMKIVAIARPRFSDRPDSRLEPASKAEIYRALAPTSVLTSPWREADRIDGLFRLVANLPTFVLHSGTDHAGRAKPIADYLRGAVALPDRAE